MSGARKPDCIESMGYRFDRVSHVIERAFIDTSKPGDFGADPLPDGTYRMVPSGEIVTESERNRRLGR